MLTQISNDLIHHFLGKSDINSLLKSQTVKSLYESLHNEYKNSKIKIEMKEMSFPTNAFIAKSIQNKLHEYKNAMTLSWTTKGRSSVRNTLHIYLDDDLFELNTQLLVDAICILHLLAINRKITIHLVFYLI